MKRILAISLLFTFSCAGRVTNTAPPGQALNNSVAIFTPSGSGHGCPVNGNIFTAAHVMGKHQGANWSDQNQNSGKASLFGFSRTSDIARLVVERGTVESLKLSKKLRPGDRVYWFEYNWSSRVKALSEKFRTAKVLRTVANHLILSQSPIPGASGGCLFAEDGGVAGIVIWGMTLKNKEKVGVAAILFPEDVK